MSYESGGGEQLEIQIALTAPFSEVGLLNPLTRLQFVKLLEN